MMVRNRTQRQNSPELAHGQEVARLGDDRSHVYTLPRGTVP